MNLFRTVANMSLGASAAIGIVLVLRLLLRRAPKKLVYALWGVVLFRLLCPWTLELPRTVMPPNAPISESAVIERQNEISLRSSADAALRAVGDTVNGGIDPVTVTIDRPADIQPEGEAAPRAVSAYHGQIWLLLLSKLWPIGIGCMAVYSLLSVIRLRRILVGAVELGDDVWLADHIESPFVWGLLRPRIYLPSGMADDERDYIILHERTHIGRSDHLTRPLAWLALCIHWFNPLVWLAFHMSGRDMEMACDEAVLDRMGSGVTRDYCTSLVRFAEGPRLPGITFSEGNVEGRVRNLLRYKKPALWLTAIAAALALLLGVLMLTSNKADEQNAEDFRVGLEENDELVMGEVGHWDVYGEMVGAHASIAYLLDRLPKAEITPAEGEVDWDTIEYKNRLIWDDRICLFGYSPQTPDVVYGQWITGGVYAQPVWIKSPDIAYQLIESVEHWHGKCGMTIRFEQYVYDKQYAAYDFDDVIAGRILNQLLPFCEVTGHKPLYTNSLPTDRNQSYVITGERRMGDGTAQPFTYVLYPDGTDEVKWVMEHSGIVYSVNENIAHSLKRVFERHYAAMCAPVLTAVSGVNQIELEPRNVSGLMGDIWWGVSLETTPDHRGMPFTLYNENGEKINGSTVLVTIDGPIGSQLTITDTLDPYKGNLGHLYPALPAGERYSVDLRMDLGNLDGLGDNEYAEYGLTIETKETAVNSQ